jgi:iron complex transport system ATP-binding protein
VVVAEAAVLTKAALTCEGLTLESRIQDVTFQLEAGCAMAVVGPNGAGKSTLLQVLAGLLSARGRIFWNGQSLAKIPFLTRGRTLAWLGQESHAEFAFPVKDVVAQGRHAWGDDGQGISEAMEQLDISHLAERPITQLSGGERRRVFLARALATRAPIQLWDEPTSSLDPRHGLEVLSLAAQLAHEGHSLLVSLHDLRQAMNFDQVLVLEKGRLTGCGVPSEVFTPELIRRVFRVETRYEVALHLDLPRA